MGWIHRVQFTESERFRLTVMDAYRTMQPKNVRYLCQLMGIHRATFYRWQRQYQRFNLHSLKHRSRRPRKLTTIDWSIVEEICRWKRAHPAKSHYYLYHWWLREGRTPPCSPKTIYNWWKRRGLIIAHRGKRTRRSTRLFNQAKLPGELFQLDTRFLPERRYQYTAIDVVSKWRHLWVADRLDQATTMVFLEQVLVAARRTGITVQRIQTDNGHEFQSQVREYLHTKQIVHQYIWVRTPNQNGVVERSHRTDEDEFYQLTPTRNLSLLELNEKLTEWTDYYNTQRLHFALQYKTPAEYLVSHI